MHHMHRAYLQDSSRVDRGAARDTRTQHSLHQRLHSTDRELQAGLGRATERAALLGEIARVLGDGLGSLAHGVLGELSERCKH